jgi:RNA polymerase sigma-70 factor (ECF subfamily)
MSGAAEREPGLLERVAAGDASAVEECTRRYAPLVWSLTRRLRCDPAEAEDTVQEIFIEVWKSAARYDPSRASEATFIATIARRRIIDRNRAKGRELPRELLEDDAASHVEPTLERLGDREEAALAMEAMSTLRPAQRHVLELAIVKGLSHSEVARATGMPLGTVKSHVRRGMERVANMLKSGSREESD